MLVVIIENRKNTCETNDCDIIKQRMNELMRVDIAVSTSSSSPQ